MKLFGGSAGQLIKIINKTFETAVTDVYKLILTFLETNVKMLMYLCLSHSYWQIGN